MSRGARRLWGSLPVALMMMTGCATAPPVEPSFEDFIAAFNERDLERFAGAYEDDATIFFDLDDPGARVSSRAAITEIFRPFFEGRSSFMLRPTDVAVQRHGDIAVVTFHLRSERALARRTIVWRWAGDRWRVMHLHASSVEPAGG